MLNKKKLSLLHIFSSSFAFLIPFIFLPFCRIIFSSSSVSIQSIGEAHIITQLSLHVVHIIIIYTVLVFFSFQVNFRTKHMNKYRRIIKSISCPLQCKRKHPTEASNFLFFTTVSFHKKKYKMETCL